MLCISLKPNEYVKIGNDIKIYNRENHEVDLGFDAPRDVKISRVPAEDNRLTK